MLYTSHLLLKDIVYVFSLFFSSKYQDKYCGRGLYIVLLPDFWYGYIATYYLHQLGNDLTCVCGLVEWFVSRIT